MALKLAVESFGLDLQYSLEILGQDLQYSPKRPSPAGLTGVDLGKL